MATSEICELGNGREGRRGTAIRQEDNVRAKYKKFRAQRDFNPDNRRGGHGDRRGFDFSMRDANYRAIIVVFWNGSPVQPRMKRRVKFRRRHEKPDGERQHTRREENAFPRPAVKW